MKKKNIIILFVVIAILGLWIWNSYNSLITENELVDNSWAQVETQYQRRLDLIPNLVNAVKGIMSQEQTVFGAIAEARTRYSGAITVNEKVKAASQMESALGRLLVIMERYPELKSVQTVRDLMTQLEGTENRVNVARMRFNDQVRLYNLKTKRFPGNIVAVLFHFSEKDYFLAAPEAKNAPVIDLDINK